MVGADQEAAVHGVLVHQPVQQVVIQAESAELVLKHTIQGLGFRV